MATTSPLLTLPASETIAANATLAIGGISYADSSAAANPGAMFLHIWDSAGLLSASNAAGVLVSGSGSNAITVSVPYADVTAVLASLSYAAGAAAGTDSINFDLWDQGGVESAGSIPVAIGASGGGNAAASDTWTGAVSGDWNTGGNWSAGAVPNSGSAVTIPGGTPNTPALSDATLSGETITLTGGGGQGGSVAFTNVALGAGSALIDAAANTLPQPAMTLGGTFTIGAGATLAADDGSLLVLQSAADGPATLVNHGTFSGAGNLNINTGGTVVNTGLITASGGIGFDFGQTARAMPAETIVNSGTLQAAGGSLFINGTVQGGTLRYSGAGSIVLEQPDALAGGATIAGFGANDTIQLYLINADSLAFANGVLTVTSGTTTVESLPMAGSYTTANFHLAYQPGPQFSNMISYVPDAPPSGPQITTPGPETVAAGGTLAVTGASVTDSSAANNPGAMALNVTDSSGTLRMTDAGGAALPGSGTGAIHFTGTFSQVNAALATLSYVAAGSGGSDSISLNVWDQLGQQATTSIAVTVGAEPATSGGGGSTGGTVMSVGGTGSTGSNGTGSSGPVIDGTLVSGTAGDDSLVSNLNGVTINAGAGNDSVFAGGTGDSITASGGNNTIQAFAGGNTISTGAGNDTIRIAGSGSVVNAGGGANIIQDSGSGNTLVLPSAGQGSDEIYGYVLNAHDLFDLRGALSGAGWNGSQATLPNYLAVGTVNDGADTTIMVGPTGGGGSVVATLHGNGAIGLPAFLGHAILA